MFVSAVLAFVAGIYLQAIYPVPATLAFYLLIGCLVLTPFLLNFRKPPVAAFLVLMGFCVAGCIRLALVSVDSPTAPVAGVQDLFAGRVVESSSSIKTVRLSYPEEYSGLRASFISNDTMPINTEIRLVGVLKELYPSFKNPSVNSWKWLKKLEGINHELKGRIVSTTPGTDLIEDARRYFKKNIEHSGARHGDILNTLTIGDRTALDEEKNRLFVRTGTSHVLAISGFNVGIISGFFFFLLRLLFGLAPTLRLSGRHTRYAALLTIPFPFVFMFVAGAGVSVIRATIMIIIYMASLFFERTRHSINTMALSALVILLIYPHSLFAPSFQLTFMSLIFIVVFLDNWYPMIARIKGRVAEWIVSAVSSTAAATLGTAPIVIYHFYGINPFTVLHNLFAVPLIGVAATGLSLIGMLHSFLAPVLWVAGWVTELNIRLLKVFDFGYIWPIVRPNLLEMLVYYAFLLPVIYIRKKVSIAVLAASLPVALITAGFTIKERFNDHVRVNFLDVGGGDSTLIEAPKGVRILIDGGGFHGSGFDIGEKVLTPFLLSKKIRTLDYMVATHPHSDHIGGLPSVFRNFRVNHFVTAGFFPDYPEFKRLIEAADRQGTKIHLWRQGDLHHIAPDFKVSVLGPPASRHFEDVNDSSLVVRAEHGRQGFLLTGDITEEIEKELVLSHHYLRADVLKVAHHGSRFSSSFPLLLAVQPRLAVIMCGPAAAKGLPGSETIGRFNDLKIPLLRTDRHGMVEVRSDGKNVTYRAFDGTRGVLK